MPQRIVDGQWFNLKTGNPAKGGEGCLLVGAKQAASLLREPNRGKRRERLRRIMQGSW